MLKPAILYKDELNRLEAESCLNPKNKYYSPCRYVNYNITIKDDSWDSLQMVSVNKNNEVIGFLEANISQVSNNVNNLDIKNYYDISIEFSRDINLFVKDLLFKYNYNKISWFVIIGNPAEKAYDKYILKHGGRIIGIKEDDYRIIDGTLCDVKMYEIMRRYFK